MGGSSSDVVVSSSSAATSGAWSCPAGSEALVLSLAGVAAQQVSGIPPNDNYSPGFSNIEGPVWIDGALYVSHISGGTAPPPSRILRWVPGGTAEVFIASAGTNGLAVDGNGALLGASHALGGVVRFNLASPSDAPVVIAGDYMGQRFNSPNDIAVGGGGSIYFSDPDWQAPSPRPQAEERVYRIPPVGPLEALGEYSTGGGAQRVAKPNGVLLSLDGNTLYVGGTGGLFRFPVMSGGAVGIGSPVTAISGGTDGLTKDCAGNIYVTHGQGVTVLNAQETLVGQIAVGASVTNVAFGGADRTTLFITSMGSTPRVYQAALNVPGFPF